MFKQHVLEILLLLGGPFYELCFGQVKKASVLFWSSGEKRHVESSASLEKFHNCLDTQSR